MHAMAPRLDDLPLTLEPPKPPARLSCGFAAVLMTVLVLGSQVALANFYGNQSKASVAVSQKASQTVAPKHAAAAGRTG